MVPSVSVIIPTFNRGGQLREALDSVAAQTFGDFETLVVDDGSTEDIAAQVADHPTHPRVVRQPRGGPAAARNRGVAASTGGLLAFLDSDDLWLPQKLERFVAALRGDGETAIWYGPMQPVDAERKPVPGRTKPCHAGRITRELFHSSFVHVPTVVCRREVFVEMGGFDESLRVCEDYDLWLRCSLRWRFGLIAEPLALRRLHGDRWSKSSMRRNLAVKLGVLERFYLAQSACGSLDDAAARHRLARVAFAAGRAACRDGHFAAAQPLLARARDCGAARMRVWPQSLLAALLRPFDRSASAEHDGMDLASART